ncbi:LuxR C-terminal-related transcriptional regulator [Rhodoplanes sp. TEM]|uniref:LuxR C-terminal-related transcriptional regulator n=1 Tax=Rhodoplanes tepidamans TaxID=200616 RepID=A0ABT5JFS9_RHOTP|nr:MULTISPECIES: LuxR C-terminal-related transcriptional regulator [Rhodoplanes]MDC7788563.1 LuxR C-terminal-related transcriptional regulator [Rhodoplanes tepidamans]MDC7986781.1 LuxR C-terminal-related transcriptional regulator [Rhodoplanes sp. TEM]MDQ0358544.1 DNA-binding CsgD family transcriptional regulator [Rhodoplanes tepidamans]
MVMLAAPIESVVSLPLQAAVLDPGGIIREANAGWRRAAAETGLPPDGGIGRDFLAHCTPEQAAGLTAVVAGRSDLFTAVCPSHGPSRTRWILMVALPLAVARPRRIAVLRLDLSGLLPAELGHRMARASHAPAELPADTRDAIVRAVEQTIARVLARPAEPAAAPDPGRSPDGEGADVMAGLPRRQRQVLALLGRGMSNAQIAGALGISMNTAKLHVSAVLRRLGLGNRMQAVALGARLSQERSEAALACNAAE